MQIIDSSSAARSLNGHALTGRVCRDRTVSEDMSVTAKPKSIVHSGNTATSTNKDASITTTTAASTTLLADVQVTVPLAASTPVFTSSNLSVATVDQSGIVTPVGNGSTNISVVSSGLTSSIVPITVSTQGGQTVVTLNNFVAGSLALAACSAIDSAISGKTPSDSTQLISSTSSFLRAAGVDLSFIAIGGNAALVSPTHILQAAHFGNGAVSFTDSSGAVYSRSVVSAAAISGTDISVGTLNAALPSNVQPVKLLPANFRSYLPNVPYGVACAYATQDKKIFVGSWVADTFGQDLRVGAPMSTSARYPWEQNLRGGDSGSPCFLVIGTTPVLLTNWHTGNAVGGGPIHSDYIAAINAAMGTESLSTINLASYPTYS